MAVSLDYRSTSSVSDDLKEKIQSEVNVIIHNFDWYCEPIAFFIDPQDRDNLTGSTKLFLIGYSSEGKEYVEVDPDEDSYLAHKDASFIIEKNVEWSKKYSITWEISVAGTSIGLFKNGRVNDQIRDFLKSMSRRSEDNPSDQFFQRYTNFSGTKIGGFPTQIQHGPSGDGSFVFQIGSEEKANWMWADNGVGHFRKTASGVWEFDCQFY